MRLLAPAALALALASPLHAAGRPTSPGVADLARDQTLVGVVDSLDRHDRTFEFERRFRDPDGQPVVEILHLKLEPRTLVSRPGERNAIGNQWPDIVRRGAALSLRVTTSPDGLEVVEMRELPADSPLLEGR